MITYNHENYIAEAIEGVMMQKTNFPIELIIGEDCSTDKTRKICQSYQTKYPDKIKLLLPDTNLGMMRNLVETFQASKSEYIAICEGDDYWTDPNKLQMQVDFLEQNEDFGIVHTNYRVVDSNNQIIHKYNRNWPSGNVFEKIINGNYGIVTATVIFRTELYKKVENELTNLDFKMGDFPMWVEISRISKVRYLSVITSSYRQLLNSASHSVDIQEIQAFHESALNIKLYYKDKYNLHFKIDSAFSIFYGTMVKECYQKKSKKMVMLYYKKMIKSDFKSVLKLKILLFMLGTKYKFFDYVIKQIYQLN